jgi:hypothetical protein
MKRVRFKIMTNQVEDITGLDRNGLFGILNGATACLIYIDPLTDEISFCRADKLAARTFRTLEELNAFIVENGIELYSPC